MKLTGSRLLLVAGAAALMAATASPAFAWTCTAKAAHGKSYTVFGITPGLACWKAMMICQDDNAKTCKVVKK